MPLTRMDEIRMVDPVLTTVAQGYTNASMVADKLFPTVQVKKVKGKIPLFGRESFMTRDTERAIRADSNRIAPSDLTLLEYETQEHDVEMAMDYLEEEESPYAYSYEQRLTKDLSDILQLGKEKEAADLAQNADNYESGMKKVISSGNAWDDYTISAVNPINDILDAVSAVRNKIGKYPNTMIIGDSAYRVLINHPKLTDRIKYAGIAKASFANLKELLGIQNIFVGASVYTDDGDTFQDVWADNVVIAYVDQNEKGKRSEYNPSFGYTLQREGKPEIDTYIENGGKIKVIRNTDNYCIKVTCNDAAYLISNTNHN